MSNCKITIRRNVRGKVQTQRYDSVEDLFKDLNFEEIPSEFLPKSAKKELIFGIPAGEGRLTTNLDSSEFEFLNINPTNPEHSNEGRLYLGTESAVPGVLIPSAVRKKDMSEVDLNKEVPLMQQLKSFISQISEAAIKGDEATASQRIQDLRNIIYVGSKAGIPINLRTENNGPITSTYLAVSRGDQVENILIKETELTKDDSVEGGFRESINVEKNTEEVSQELTQALVNVKAPFQVNKNDINGKWTIDRTLDYNNVLAEADVLTTNLEKNEVSQAYFVMNPLNSKLEEVKVNNAPIKTAKGTGGVSSTDSPLGREVTIEEGTFRVREGNKVYDSKNNPVTNKETILKVITHDYLNNLSKEELEAITFKGREIPGIKSLHLGQTFQLMPNNRVWAGNRYLPTNDSTHNLIMEMNEKRKAEVKSQTPITSEVLSDIIKEGPMTVQEVIDTFKQISERFTISEDEKWYIDKKTGKKYSRVTSYISDRTVESTPDIKLAQLIGNTVDAYTRDFFDNTLKDISAYSNVSREALQNLHKSLEELKKKFDSRGETVISKEVTLFSDELDIAGTVDLITYDKEGNFRIYDMKTKKHGMKWVDSTQFGKSSREQWTDQLSMYRILLNNTFGITAVETGIILVETQYEAAKRGDTESSVLNMQEYMPITPKDNFKDAHMKEEIGIKETKEPVPEGLSQEETITKEIPLFGKKETESKETRVRKRPKRGGVTNTALDSQQSSEMTTEQIQEEINRQKEYQKKNCPEIKP